MGRQPPVQGREGRQRGLSHTQGHRHGLADVQRLVDGQPAEAVGVEVVRRQKRLRAHERRLKRGQEGDIFSGCSSNASSARSFCQKVLLVSAEYCCIQVGHASVAHMHNTICLVH